MNPTQLLLAAILAGASGAPVRTEDRPMVQQITRAGSRLPVEGELSSLAGATRRRESSE